MISITVRATCPLSAGGCNHQWTVTGRELERAVEGTRMLRCPMCGHSSDHIIVQLTHDLKELPK